MEDGGWLIVGRWMVDSLKVVGGWWMVDCGMLDGGCWKLDVRLWIA